MEKFDVVIVGAGLAGLSAAYTLARAGVEVVVIERGDYPGAKNVTGGRLYVNPVRQYLPDIWEEAPLERHVTNELLTMMSSENSTTIRFRSEKFNRPPYQSYTVLRGTFDRWLASKAEAEGAMLVTKNLVDDVIKENGRVIGVVAGGEELGADVVIACDGVLSLIAEKAGLRSPGDPRNYAVGLKEVIELPRETLEDRFGLTGDEGVAQLFMGSLTQGCFGGGFLYTNKSSISLGMVVGVKDLMEKKPQVEVPYLLEEFKQRPEIAPLIKGGELVEYSAHVIPEGGMAGLTTLFSDGLLVAGDAAGFSLNMGITVRGMEFAIASGVIAARAVQQARERNDFSAASLACYQQMLEQSFVLQDFKTFRHAPQFLENPRLFSFYPEFADRILEEVFTFGEGPKAKLSDTVRKHLSFGEAWRIARDLWGGLKI
ncbi:MAG: FAD-dependent oxidoreductase [Syntrophomonadaceae bacterium]|nr:FAD-dependent oxidoreductase [Syntrophomonadaceae bacterium]